MKNARLDESQARNKIAMRIINNLRNAVGTPLMAESKEELKSLLMKVGVESEKAGLKLSIQKPRPWIQSHNFTANIGRKSGNSVRLYFLGL